jgi:hypothetical protein
MTPHSVMPRDFSRRAFEVYKAHLGSHSIAGIDNWRRKETLSRRFALRWFQIPTMHDRKRKQQMASC